MEKNIKGFKEKGKALVSKLKNRKKAAVISVSLICGLLLLLLPVSFIIAGIGKGSETVYKETEAVKGNLTVGITESGTVDIGTVAQTFDLDLSELVRYTSADSSGSSQSSAQNAMGNSQVGMGGMDMFDQIFGFASQSGQDTTAGSGTLEVEEVMVSIGQQVQEGEVLYTLTEESVGEIRERLKSDVEKASADLELIYAQQEEDRLSAQHTYDSCIAYGKYAQTEYDAAVSALEEEAANKEKSLELAREELALYEERLAQAQNDYAIAAEMLDRTKWSEEHTDKWESTFLYVEYVNLRMQAQSAAAALENEIEQLEVSIEQTRSSVEMLEKEFSKAERELALGKLTAQETYDLRMLAYDAAQETYDIAIAYLEEDAAEQEEIYENAQQRREAFNSRISENSICAQYNGIITDVCLEKGDILNTDDILISLYDLEEVTMTVSVDEDDMTDIREGTLANVVFTAYPDKVFQAEVTEISDAVTSSSGLVSYSVTVKLQGDVSGLYQGMTGDITFITKESREVIYVSNRAVIRKDGKSYVKMKDDNGNVKTVEVQTGFSDGVNVEIVEGLSQGDIVLIESKVSN